MYNCLKRICCCKKSICSNSSNDEYLKEYQYFEKQKPNYQSFLLPIIVLVVLAVLLLLPFGFSQTTCPYCFKVSLAKATDPKDIDFNDILKDVCHNTATSKETVAVSSDHIVVEQYHSWPIMVFRLLGAIILLIAIVLLIKNLVPYWVRIAELNDKQNERLTRLAAERLDFERLPQKTAIDIMEKQAKINMEKNNVD